MVCILCYSAAEDCGGSYTEESGTIDYPPGDSNYGYNEICMWVLKLPDSSKRIFVNVTKFDLQNHTSCDLDFLEASF